MSNELGFTVSVNVSRINDTSALVTTTINNLPVGISLNSLVICRSAVDTPDDIGTLHYEEFPQLSEFPLSYVDDGTVIVPGGGGSTTNKPIDPTKSYIYSVGITTQPLVVQEWGQATLPPSGSAPTTATLSSKAAKGKKK